MTEELAQMRPSLSGHKVKELKQSQMTDKPWQTRNLDKTSWVSPCEASTVLRYGGLLCSICGGLCQSVCNVSFSNVPSFFVCNVGFCWIDLWLPRPLMSLWSRNWTKIVGQKWCFQHFSHVFVSGCSSSCQSIQPGSAAKLERSNYTRPVKLNV